MRDARGTLDPSTSVRVIIRHVPRRQVEAGEFMHTWKQHARLVESLQQRRWVSRHWRKFKIKLHNRSAFPGSDVEHWYHDADTICSVSFRNSAVLSGGLEIFKLGICEPMPKWECG